MKFGVIGMGNMGSTILKAAIQSDYVKAYETNIYDVNPDQCKKFSDVYAVNVMESNLQLVKESDFILLAVKPQYMKGLLQEIQRHVRNKRLISIAAGWTMEMLQDGLLVHDTGTQLLRVMPNTPALVGEGYTAFCEETTFNGPSLKWAKGLFSCLGMVQSFPESLFDAVVATTSSSPAYVYMFIEAMADGAVKLGLPRKVAIQAAAQAVLGSAKMVLCSGEHPAQLKDNVCSPAGTTIEAVGVLEKSGFRGIIMNAMDACAQKNRKFVQAYERRKNER